MLRRVNSRPGLNDRFWRKVGIRRSAGVG